MVAKARSQADQQAIRTNTSGDGVQELDHDLSQSGIQSLADVEKKERDGNNPLLANRGISGIAVGTTEHTEHLARTDAELDPYEKLGNTPDPRRADYTGWLGLNNSALLGAKPPLDPQAPWDAFDKVESAFTQKDGNLDLNFGAPDGIAAMQRGAVLLGAEKSWELAEAAGKPFAASTRRARQGVKAVLDSGLPMME